MMSPEVAAVASAGEAEFLPGTREMGLVAESPPGMGLVEGLPSSHGVNFGLRGIHAGQHEMEADGGREAPLHHHHQQQHKAEESGEGEGGQAEEEVVVVVMLRGHQAPQ
eukprot:scaffold224247_cov15-Tisochrysis_lutea.AAC.1